MDYWEGIRLIRESGLSADEAAAYFKKKIRVSRK